MSESVPIAVDDILVRAQETPNPSAIKFVVNFSLKNDGKATFHSAQECEGLPLAKSLFDILGVRQVYFFKNTLTITHNGELGSENLKQQVESVIRTRLAVHDPNFMAEDEMHQEKIPVDRSHLSDEMRQIEEILDRTIRPGLQADGGDVDVISFEDDELKILYQGACGGCPSAMMGTLDAIQGILRNELKNDTLRVTPI